LKVDADLSNLATVLRFAQNPAERDLLRERFEDGDLAHLFLGPGQLPYALLERAGYQDTVEAATALLAGTPYETPLHAGLAEYARSGRLSDMERALRRFRLAWMAGQIPKDPLGIGVVLGYVALKVNEVNNIRWIAQGINQGLPVEAIRAGVELVL
jgi:vacuolar-type H+-ATPase subunit C/Vma6